jgi:hypothetical protein
MTSALSYRLLGPGLLIMVTAWAAGQAPESNPHRSVSPEEIRQLVDKLGDDKFRVREWATRELIGIGKLAVPALREATHSRDAEIVCRAQRILVEIQTSLPYLIDSLRDRNPQVRREAAQMLERIGPSARDSLPTLLAALGDADESVRDAVVGALLAIDPINDAIIGMVPSRAHVEGKYYRLLRRLRQPDDRQSYSEFRDYGFYQACDWAGHRNVPAGFWVYVYPYWYIWKDESKGR